MAKNPSSSATARAQRVPPATRIRTRLTRSNYETDLKEKHDNQGPAPKSRKARARRRQSADKHDDDPPDLSTKVLNLILDAAVVLAAVLSALTIIGFIIAAIAYARADNRPSIAAVRDLQEGMRWSRETLNRIRDQGKKDKRILEDYVSNIASDVASRAPVYRDNVVRTAAHGMYYILWPDVRNLSGEGKEYDSDESHRRVLAHVRDICLVYEYLLTLKGTDKVPTFYKYLGLSYEKLAGNPRALENGVWRALKPTKTLEETLKDNKSGVLTSDQVDIMVGNILLGEESRKVYDDFMKAIGSGPTQVRDPHRFSLLKKWCGHGYLGPFSGRAA
ncbi:hypothetical protein B0T22DRAFT_438683 [Podospora appendiculata]|uniref:Uncharacterized protein n=1 Tax=Podospora appendiculata TaxID=314037 RepID=A0AAE0XLJ5_9PEZI|nr:hypothetical protein B0T22DRAFT_438683 [Podospora appendiculata]